MKPIRLKAAIAVLSMLLSIVGVSSWSEADEVSESSSVDLSGYSFCAICEVERTGGEDAVFWFKYKPKKIFWGSHVDFKDRLYENKGRFKFKDDNDMRGRDYLILCADREGPTEFSVFKCVPISPDGVDVRSLGGLEKKILNRNELQKILLELSTTMLKEHPVDQNK